MQLSVNKIHLINCIDGLPLVEKKSVDTCVTSVPYFNLRDYEIDPTVWPAITYRLFGQLIKVKKSKVCLGLEKEPKEFIGHLIHIYRLVRETLKETGTCWVNIGDSYASVAGGYNSIGSRGKTASISHKTQSSVLKSGNRKPSPGLKPKDMLGIPWMLAFALREDGWFLRQDIIWAKPNAMPENITDRCTKSHEYIFLISKSNKYYYDHIAIATPSANAENYKTPDGWDTGKGAHGSFHKNGREKGTVAKSETFKRDSHKQSEPIYGQNHVQHRPDRKEAEPSGLANKRSVWIVPTFGFKEAHYATYPPDLIKDCIKASCSEGGCCVNCGKPYKRIFSKELIPTSKASYNSKVDERDLGADKMDAGSNRQKDENLSGHINTFKTAGWKKQCNCHTQETKPAVVLDMFMGSGTTFIVAAKFGFDCIGMEQSEKSHKISTRRLHKELGLFNPSK